MAGPRGIQSQLSDGYRTTVRVGGSHLVVVDEPLEVGGRDTGPTPMELVGAALAGCISITLQMVAQRKGWPLQGIATEVRLSKEPVEGERPRDAFEVDVTLQGPLDEAMRAELTRIASRCPVHQLLVHDTPVHTQVR